MGYEFKREERVREKKIERYYHWIIAPSSGVGVYIYWEDRNLAVLGYIFNIE